MFSHISRIGLVVAAAALLAACSSGANGPQVAALGGTTTTGTAANASGGGNDGPQAVLKYSACMRSHGLPKFPDPQISGNRVSMIVGSKSGIDPRSPVFQAAQKACQQYMKPGGPAGGKALDPTKIAKWAACMRSHGLPHFPDPTNDGGALKLNMTGTGVNPNTSTFDNAMRACQSLRPGGGIEIQAGTAGPGGGR